MQEFRLRRSGTVGVQLKSVVQFYDENGFTRPNTKRLDVRGYADDQSSAVR
jgi:hypothetical protein